MELCLLFRSLLGLWLVQSTPRVVALQCKTTASSPDWPSPQTWAHFNTSIVGKLLAPLPPAVVCDKKMTDTYNATTCADVAKEWFFQSFHDDDPISLHQPNWQHDACLPTAIYDGTQGCDLRPFPKYTVNASNADDVVHAVRFAQQHNLRMSIKNTGHDYLGRSTSPEFSLWTHHLKGITFDRSFKPAGCSYSTPGVSALTVGAGNQLADIYSAADANGVIVVGGAEPSVGLGGYLTSGGHSPLGALYGLAVDNVLEMQVVTPAGDLVTANDCQHTNLFWAMRGGGGSTFGVLISATLKTFENLPASTFVVMWGSTQDEASKNNNTNFFSILADMYQQIPRWSDHYINGYIQFGALSARPSPNVSVPMYCAFIGFAHNSTLAQTHRYLDPFMRTLNATAGIESSLNFTHVQRTSQLLGTRITNTDSGVGANAILGSRLWPREAFSNKTALLRVLRTTSQASVVQGLMVSGPGLRNAANPNAVSVTPTWRDTYLHSLVALSWEFHNATAAKITKHLNTDVLTKALRDHAPGMGAYLNEADKFEPDYQQTFWGSNYERLLKIKRQYDPNGLFWCVPCIGNEDWQYDETTSKLCKV